ncbi:MAG: hypothetical protein J6X30_05215 [Clostridia bacterium]|nr:hypothetical protein [Clostridia bacterium]
MRKIDLHTHVLPGIDDGSASVEESKTILQLLKQQGLTDVCLTPHFYAHRMSMEKFLARREHAFEQIADSFTQLGLTPHMGAEVFFEDSLFGSDTLTPLCLDGGSYILIELSSATTDEKWVKDHLNRLFANYSVIPILVHLERYRHFFRDDFLEEILQMGCHVQFDIGALAYRWQRKHILHMLDNGLIELVGSDCHDSIKRPPNFDLLQKYLPQEWIDTLFKNNDHILLDM